MPELDDYAKLGLSAYLAGDPQLTFGPDGTARLWVRVGVKHPKPLEGGGFDDSERTFHDLVQFGKGAERTADLYVRGDNIIAYGSTRVYEREVDGERRSDKQFVATVGCPDPHQANLTLSRRNGPQTTTMRRGPDQVAAQTGAQVTQESAAWGQAQQQPDQQPAGQPYPQQAPTQQPPAQHQSAQLGDPSPLYPGPTQPTTTRQF